MLQVNYISINMWRSWGVVKGRTVHMYVCVCVCWAVWHVHQNETSWFRCLHSPERTWLRLWIPEVWGSTVWGRCCFSISHGQKIKELLKAGDEDLLLLWLMMQELLHSYYDFWWCCLYYCHLVFFHISTFMSCSSGELPKILSSLYRYTVCYIKHDILCHKSNHGSM